jgi:hypothetical protein
VSTELFPSNGCHRIITCDSDVEQSYTYITTDGQSASLSWCQAPIKVASGPSQRPISVALNDQNLLSVF